MHTKRQVYKWKFLQHALSCYVYNRNMYAYVISTAYRSTRFLVACQMPTLAPTCRGEGLITVNNPIPLGNNFVQLGQLGVHFPTIRVPGPRRKGKEGRGGRGVVSIGWCIKMIMIFTKFKGLQFKRNLKNFKVSTAFEPVTSALRTVCCVVR